MAESSLSLSIAEIAAEVGGFLGFGFTPSNWTGWSAAAPYVPQPATINGQSQGANDTQLGWVMACINAGLRQFYRPPMSEPHEAVAHKWSFLSPEAQMTLTVGVSDYDLPDFFSTFEGELYFQPTANTWNTIKRVGIGEIRAALQVSTTLTLAPYLVATLPKDSDGVLGQRFKAVFYPPPDQAYVLTFRYNLQGRALTAANPYPLGGVDHAETILESCLAVAESRRQDGGTLHADKFRERLQASIAADDQNSQPEGLGYNADKSRFPSEGNYPYGPWRHGWNNDLMTINGVVPG